MSSLLNKKRPPAFCHGCSHELITKALDKAFQNMGLDGSQVVIVSDIGCSGLFDTFFNTHALHGLHGRALTYATGIKLAQPDLHVIVTMGDGGLGIGGAHLLGTCRRNIDLTLLILNNFNYGMTGGQCSSTTPQDSQVGSGFLNRIEKPMDVCSVLGAAGAGYLRRMSSYEKGLAQEIEAAIRFEGFSAMDIWGICPGRFTRQNKLTPKSIKESISELPTCAGPIESNKREEYGLQYRKMASAQKPLEEPLRIEAKFSPLVQESKEIIILGSAGQRIVTAGEILCYAGLTAGLNATQKNDYPITVLRGHSITELILSSEEIGYTGIESPDVIIAIGQDGVNRRKDLFENLKEKATIISAEGIELPNGDANTLTVDFKGIKIKNQDRALASLAILAGMENVIDLEMLNEAIAKRFKGKVRDESLELVKRAGQIQ